MFEAGFTCKFPLAVVVTPLRIGAVSVTFVASAVIPLDRLVPVPNLL